MNIRRTGEEKNIAVFVFLPTVYEGACDWRQREITAEPPIRPNPFGVPVALPN
jgi:hypothetical protein